MEKVLFQYKGFSAHPHVSGTDACIHGKLEGIEDLVTFEGRTVEEAEIAFREAVEDYLISQEDLT